MKKVEKGEFLEYKGKPLVRCDKTLYYGSIAERYVVMIQILSVKQVNGLEIADKILVQLMDTDENVRARDRILKKSEKSGLYDAIDIGAIWLERALAGKLS